MKPTLSKIIANIRALWYGGTIKYHHINTNGYWEYEIGVFHYFFAEEDVILFKTKGLRNGK